MTFQDTLVGCYLLIGHFRRFFQQVDPRLLHIPTQTFTVTRAGRNHHLPMPESNHTAPVSYVKLINISHPSNLPAFVPNRSELGRDISRMRHIEDCEGCFI